LKLLLGDVLHGFGSHDFEGDGPRAELGVECVCGGVVQDVTRLAAFQVFGKYEAEFHDLSLSAL